MSTLQFVIFGLISVALLGSGTALECYECTSTNNGGPCGDEEFTSRDTTTSATEDLGLGTGSCAYCFKSKASYMGTTAVVRGCLSNLGVYKIDTCQNIEVENIKTDVCICSTEKCNGVGMVTGSILLVVAASLVKYLW